MPALGTLAAASISGFEIGMGDTPVVGTITTGVTTSGSPAPNSLTFSVPVANGLNRILIVSVASEAEVNDIDGQVATMTFNGIAMTFVSGVSAVSGTGRWCRVEFWMLLNPPVGSFSLVTTLSGAGTRSGFNVAAIPVFNVKQVTPYVTANTGVTTNVSSISTNITTTKSNTLLLDAVAHASSAATFTALNSQTKIFEIASTGGLASAGGSRVVNSGTLASGWSFPTLATQAATHLVIGLSNIYA